MTQTGYLHAKGCTATEVACLTWPLSRGPSHVARLTWPLSRGYLHVKAARGDRGGDEQRDVAGLEVGDGGVAVVLQTVGTNRV